MSQALAGSETLLQTILSLLLTIGFLTALIIALFLVLTVLQSVRGTLEKVALGVRAIDSQAAPLERASPTLAPALEETAAALDALAERLERTLPRLDAALRASLERRQGPWTR